VRVLKKNKKKGQMDYRNVLHLTLSYMLQEEPDKDVVRNTFVTCTLVDRWFHNFCRNQLNQFSSADTPVDVYLESAKRQFLFFTVNYMEHEITPVPLTLRQLATTMVNVMDRLGGGYTIYLGYSCEGGFILNTPDGRQCDVRFTSDVSRPPDVRTVDDIMLLDDTALDTDCLSLRSTIPHRHVYEIIHGSSVVTLRPKNINTITVREYQVLCECFAAATGTQMMWSSERMWRGVLTPFQDWIIDNRRRFNTLANIRFVTDTYLDPLFPHSNPYEMLSYLQWVGADDWSIKRFLVIYGVYEAEMLNTAFVEDFKCQFCKQAYTLQTNYALYCKCPQYQQQQQQCGCMCDWCGKQVDECSDHWCPNSRNNGCMCAPRKKKPTC